MQLSKRPAKGLNSHQLSRKIKSTWLKKSVVKFVLLVPAVALVVGDLHLVGPGGGGGAIGELGRASAAARSRLNEH